MHRFFVTADSRAADDVTLTGGIAHQIARVLRLRSNEEIVLIPTNGEDAVEWRVRLGTVETRMVAGTVVAERPGLPEPRCAVTLCAAVLKGERFDWLVQKATELGVAVIKPVVTAHTIRRVGPDDTKALERWRRIATEAAEQSGRSRAPIIGAPVALMDIVGSVPAPLFVAHESVTTATFASIVPANADTLSVIVGPEGGLAESEVEHLVAKGGALQVSLGPRILRAETAAITAVTLVMAATENLAPARERAWHEIRDR
ncbi:MAG: RsmE family RNA methyltransferase [Thermomicrobiales bacterium]